MRTLTWLATLLVSGTALAENADLMAARRAFDEVDFERVIPFLDKALASGPSDPEKVEIFVLMGQVHMAYGHTAEAERAFIEALTIDRSHSLPETVAPKISAAFEVARSRVPVQEVSAQPVVEDGPLTPPVDDRPPEPIDGDNLLSQWWLWAVVGTVVAGSSGILAWQLTRPTEPPHDHGPFRWIR